MTEYLELRAVAFDLIKFIVKKYDIKDYEGFTCPLNLPRSPEHDSF